MVTVRWWDELRGSHTLGKCTVMEAQPHRDLSNSCCPSSTSRRLPQACDPHGPTLGLVLPASCCVLVLWPIPPVRGQGHLRFCVKEGNVFQLLQNVGEAEEAEPHQKGKKAGLGLRDPRYHWPLSPGSEFTSSLGALPFKEPCMDHMAQGPKVAMAGGISAAEFRNLRLEELPGSKAFLQEVTAGSQQLAAPVHTAH